MNIVRVREEGRRRRALYTQGTNPLHANDVVRCKEFAQISILTPWLITSKILSFVYPKILSYEIAQNSLSNSDQIFTTRPIKHEIPIF